MNISRKVPLFFLGGSGYMGLELLWRGYSHGSMFLAGGVCFLLLGRLEEARPRLPWLLRGMVGAGIITMVELAMGLAVNRSYQIWDYRPLPGNYMGQICPQYSLLWVPVALGGMDIYAKAEALLEKTRGRHKARPGAEG